MCVCVHFFTFKSEKGDIFFTFLEIRLSIKTYEPTLPISNFSLRENLEGRYNRKWFVVS